MKRSLVLLLLLVSCATAGGPVTSTPDPLLDIETYLRRIPTMRMRYYVETKGAVEMLARGSMSWDANHVRLDVSGTLAGEPKSVRYDRPYDLKRDIAESWVRIGLAHNLFRVMNGKEVETIPSEAANVKLEDGRYVFDVIVEGKRIGSAQLWLDAAGLPLRREQTVRFPQGEMQVTERYLWLP